MKETREILLDLGEAAVRSRGYAGFSYADLARDAGIRKASIHHHFPTKADLALALVERYDRNLEAALAGFSEKSKTAGEALGAVIQLYRDALNEGSTMCLCAALSTDAALVDDATLKALQEANVKTADWLESVFKAGRSDGSIALSGTPDQEAHAALTVLQGAQLLSRTAGSTKPFDAATQLLRARIKS